MFFPHFKITIKLLKCYCLTQSSFRQYLLNTQHGKGGVSPWHLTTFVPQCLLYLSPIILFSTHIIQGLFFFSFLKVLLQLIYNVVVISAVQLSDSVIHVHTSILFQILFCCCCFHCTMMRTPLSDSFPTYIITEYWVAFSVIYTLSQNTRQRFL